MCEHRHRGRRLDPGECSQSGWAACGAYFPNTAPGEPAPAHQAEGERDMCPGAGNPTVG
ncbi:hypothetical protein [Streptomyces aureocirculatus]|uniref:hypothetical protein n=1 Tax=Streptomyces aureocirculatus TaxID=67275 RepID=UPI0012FF2B33|nr:hypothetical protein [Streptomyces aureocirculatus]